MGRGVYTAPSFVSRADHLIMVGDSGLEDADSCLLAGPPRDHVQFEVLVSFVISFPERKQIKI